MISSSRSGGVIAPRLCRAEILMYRGIGTGSEFSPNQLVALNDHVVGTKVADSISTFAGDDTIQGGGGDDQL